MDRSNKPSFNFVNIKHPDDLKDEETQLRIRRLAMTEVGKARRKPKTKRERNEIVLALREPAEDQPGIPRFGGGSIDPFTSFPIELDDSVRALVAHVFSPNTNHASQLRGCWYPVGLSCAAACHNMLANSQNFIFQKIRGYFPSQDDGVALVHHHKALREANAMMKDPAKCRSDEILGTIASFMCHIGLMSSFSGDAWERHRNALLRIVSLRGGFDVIRKEDLRITLSWAELMGAFTQDLPPAIPLPRQWEQDSKSQPNSPRPISPISLIWKREFPMRLDWISIFDDVVQLVSLDKALGDEQVVLAMTSGSWMEPTIWRLLVIRPILQGREREHVIEEVCRLGTLLFLAPVWRTLGHTPVWTAAISRKLMLILTEHMIEWKDLKPLLLWVLYFAAVETQDLGERSQLVFMIAVLMSGLQLSRWDQLMQLVKELLWVEKVCSASDDLIREEVMTIVECNSMRLVESAPPELPDFFLDDFEAFGGDEEV